MASADRPAISYTPGTWPGVVRSGTVVLLRPGTDPALLDSLWSLLAGQPEVHEVLDAVTAASGGSLARLPWFGIVSLRGSLQVFLRGDIDLEVRLAGGEASALSGRDVTTWTERRFASADGFTLSAPDAASDAARDAALPLGEGVVMLRELNWSPAGATASAPAGGPASNAAAPVEVEEQLLAATEADIAAEAANLETSLAPFGWLDAPTESDRPSGPVSVGGWVLDNRGVVTVEAWIDGTDVVPLTLGVPRPDVDLVWPGYPDGAQSGYSGTVDFGPAGACPRLLEIVATDTDGNQRVIASRLITPAP